MAVFPHMALSEYEQFRVRRVSLKTWATERYGLLNLCDYLTYLNLRMDEVTPEHLDDWWYGQELSDATRHTRLSQVRVFFRFCMDVKHWVDEDPTILLSARKPMTEPNTWLDAQALLALIESAQWPQHRICLALAANLGLRASELKRLRIADVWGDKIRVRVEKTRQVDDMPVNTDLAAEIERWLPEYQRNAERRLRRSDPLVPSQYRSTVSARVIYRPDKGPIGNPEDVVHAALRTLQWELPEGEGVGIHLVRRSMARIFYDVAAKEDGENDALLATMRLLHHAKPTTTLRYIGVDRQTEARDRVLAHKPFLTRLVGAQPLAIAQ